MEPDATEVTVSIGAAKAAAWFFENTLNIFLAVHEETLKVANGRWQAITGWKAEETTGRSLFEFLHPDDEDAARSIIQELPFRERTVVDLRLKAKTGAWLCMETQIVRGELGWLLMVMSDVTAERQREIDAEEALQTAALLQEMAGVTIWRFDPETNQYSADPDFTRSGRQARAYNSHNSEAVRRRLHPDDRAALREAWRDSLATGASHVVDYRERGPDGAWRRIRATWQGIRRLPSGRWELLGISQDVTDLVGARKAKRIAA